MNRVFFLGRDYDLLRRTWVDFNLFLVGARSASAAALATPSPSLSGGRSSTGCNICERERVRRAVMSVIDRQAGRSARRDSSPPSPCTQRSRHASGPESGGATRQGGSERRCNECNVTGSLATTAAAPASDDGTDSTERERAKKSPLNSTCGVRRVVYVDNYDITNQRGPNLLDLIVVPSSF